MRIDELVQREWYQQERAIRQGLPAKALKECAELIEVSPSKLARILGITRKPKRLYSMRAGEKIWRVANLRREVSQCVGLAKVNEFLKTPCRELNGDVPLTLTRLWTGACLVREIVANRSKMSRGIT